MSGAALPAEPAYDAIIQKLESTPLFMRDLPDDPSEDPTLAALQSLLYEGTPDEVAQNFKEQGNEAFKERRVRDALGFYAQGVGARPADGALLEALLCNRAACNLELQNYGSVLRDCANALSKNFKCSKAWYRSALALNALERYEEAIDCCKRCLAYDPGNASVKAALAKAESAFAAQRKKVAEKAERARKAKEEKQKLDAALAARKLFVVPRKATDAPNEAPPIRFDAENPNADALIIPVFLLYPQHATSDFITEFHEDTTFADHLAVVFEAKPPWDVKGEYDVANLTVYAASRNHRLFKIGKDKTLREAISAPLKGLKPGEEDGLEIREGCLSFVVLPRGPEEKKWVENYKKEHGTAR